MVARLTDGRHGCEDHTLPFIPASAIPARGVQWLWTERVPLGKLTILAGQAGQGKSQLTATIAAGVSKGSMPGALVHNAANVLMISAEDDPSDTIVPRLLAVEADLDRVQLLDLRGDVESATIVLPRDVERLADAVEQWQARLVVIDPVSGFLDERRSSWSSQHVRQALGPLKALAETYGCAVLAVKHLNKGTSTDPLVRIADSAAYTGLARSVLVLGADPHDPDGRRGSRKVLAVGKANLARPGEHSLSLVIEPATVPGADGPVETSRIDVVGPATASVADVLGDDEARTSSLAEARAFLADALRDGPRPAREVEHAAAAAGLAPITLKRAKTSLNVRSSKGRGADLPWYWRLDPLEPLGSTTKGDQGDQVAGAGDPEPLRVGDPSEAIVAAFITAFDAEVLDTLPPGLPVLDYASGAERGA